MLIKCPTCGKQIPMGWLFLGMPWSKYTCTECSSVYAGTHLRTLLIFISSGFLGYLLIGAIKGTANLLLLPLAMALTFMFLFVDLPMQIKRVDAVTHFDDLEPTGDDD